MRKRKNGKYDLKESMIEDYVKWLLIEERSTRDSFPALGLSSEIKNVGQTKFAVGLCRLAADGTHIFLAAAVLGRAVSRI